MWKDLCCHPLTTSFQALRKTSHTSKFKETLKSADLRKAGGCLEQGGGWRAQGSSSSVALSSAIDLLSERSALPNPPPHCCPTLSGRIIHIDRCRWFQSRSWCHHATLKKGHNCHSPSVLSREHASRIDFCKDLTK